MHPKGTTILWKIIASISLSYANLGLRIILDGCTQRARPFCGKYQLVYPCPILVFFEERTHKDRLFCGVRETLYKIGIGYPVPSMTVNCFGINVLRLMPLQAY